MEEDGGLTWTPSPCDTCVRQRGQTVFTMAPVVRQWFGGPHQPRGQVEDVIRSRSELAKRDPHDVYVEVRRNEISLGREQASGNDERGTKQQEGGQ